MKYVVRALVLVSPIIVLAFAGYAIPIGVFKVLRGQDIFGWMLIYAGMVTIAAGSGLYGYMVGHRSGVVRGERSTLDELIRAEAFNLVPRRVDDAEA